MKQISYALAAWATIAFVVPSIAIAQDAKPAMKESMKKEDGMKGDMTKMRHHHRHHHHHHHHKMMKKDM